MNIVILTGGTGSIALQTGLFNVLEKYTDGVDIKIIVNGYDSGLSTGVVRRVCGGKILGPSDIRKNQTTRLKLQDPTSPWNKFLNIRFTCTAFEARDLCRLKINDLYLELSKSSRLTEHCSKIYSAVDFYFKFPDALRVDYTDFSLANIVYAGLAAMNGNSIRKAATIMSEALCISDNVLVNDDTSLFLSAVTASGIHVHDEADIVSWGNKTDSFVDLAFKNYRGDAVVPVLCKESRDSLIDADLIILSSGTQWSSLIPTYASVGFKAAIEDSAADIIMVSNKFADKDSPGQSTSDIIDIICPKYFPVNRIKVLSDSNGSSLMNTCTSEKVVSNTIDILSIDDEFIDNVTHNPELLAFALGDLYFKEYLESEVFAFDYDDTLVGRDNKFPKSSRCNIELLNKRKRTSPAVIVTGNSIRAISCGINSRATIYAEGGINKYVFSGSEHILEKCLDRSKEIDVEIIYAMLEKLKIPQSKIENRANVTVAIKPVDPEYRMMMKKLLDMILPGQYIVTITGRTTVEISKGISKSLAILDIMKSHKTMTYVGDELYTGNDSPVLGLSKTMNIKCLNVKTPAKTAFFNIILNHNYD
jgi:2-phospho-L-lactate transferase/gluconeogenesis factor (CofD/UPF0052 family)